MKKTYRLLCVLTLIFLVYGSTVAQKRHPLLPDYMTVQHAGSMGWLSAGADYDIFKERARVGVMYGYVPGSHGGPLHLVSASLFYRPWQIDLSPQLSLTPVDLGFKVSYHFGDQFYTKLPSRYPEGYYWWKSALRFHLATQTGLTLALPDKYKIRSVTGYMELNTNELYLISYVLNIKSLRLSEIIKTGIGVRLRF